MIKKCFAAFAGIILSAALFAGCSKAKADVEIANFTPPQKGEKIGVINPHPFPALSLGCTFPHLPCHRGECG